MAQRSLPLRPPPETWGDATVPHTPSGTKGRGCGPSPLETPPGVGRGSGSGKKGRGRPVWNIGVRRTFWCGDTVLGGIGIAQPVGDFWIWSAVCDGQPPVLGDLTPSCQIIPQRFFFCTVSGTFSFWQDKKKMWGTFCTAKPCFLSRKPGPPFAPLWRGQNNLLVKCQNPWYDNMKNLKGCLR